MLVFVFPAGLQKIQTIQLEIIIGVDYFTDVLYSPEIGFDSSLSPFFSYIAGFAAMAPPLDNLFYKR